MLMFGRFIQGFGGSIGSVLGQAVCRDSFEGSSLNKVYATVAAALAFFPAIGPVVGGIIAEFSNWHNIFIFLVFIVLLVFILTVFFLPETHHRDKRKSFNFLKVAKSLLVNKHVMSMAFIVSVCNGIMFSSFAEGPFYLIAILGLTPKQYGMTFVVIAFAASFGGIFSRKMLSKVGGIVVMSWGIKIVCISNLILSVAVLICQYFSVDKSFLIAITILAQMFNMFGFSMTASNALSMALVDFKWCVGTASSIFGFFYYCLISFFTLLMGLLHNGTLIIMPLYFFSLSVLMLMVYKVFLRR
jgi:MFS family permease